MRHAPEETVRRVLGLRRALGITRVANVTGLDVLGIPVVMVYRPNARSLAVSQGKGLTLAAAQASGLMEALEVWHAERITLPLKLASHDELRFTHEVADLARLPRRAGGTFRDDLRLLWIEAHELHREGRAWVPFELVHIDLTHPSPPGSGAFPCSTNGLASGNTLDEATLHAITEVIEREGYQEFLDLDAAGQDARRIRLETVDDPAAQSLLERFATHHVDVAVWETTDATGIPSFTCEIAGRDEGPYPRPGTFSGAGCHPSRAVALCRALTEAAQTRLTVISGARDDLSRLFHERVVDPARIARERARREWRGAGRAFRDVPTQEVGDATEGLAWVLERCAQGGYDSVLRVELTREEFGVPVVKVIIPGTRGIGGLAPTSLGPDA